MSTPRALLLAIASWTTLLSGIWLIASVPPSSSRPSTLQTRKPAQTESSKPNSQPSHSPPTSQGQEKLEESSKQDETKQRIIGSFAETGILE